MVSITSSVWTVLRRYGNTALRAYSCPDLLELECHTSQTDPLPACLHPEVTGVITEAEPTQIHEDLVGLEHSS
jgi:hypothetical protein